MAFPDMPPTSVQDVNSAAAQAVLEPAKSPLVRALVIVSELIVITVLSIVSPYLLQVANFLALVLDASVYVLLALGLTFVVTNAVFLIVAASAIAWYLLNRTLIGRYALAIGSNEEVTRLSGVNVRRWKLCVYTLGETYRSGWNPHGLPSGLG